MEQKKKKEIEKRARKVTVNPSAIYPFNSSTSFSLKSILTQAIVFSCLEIIIEAKLQKPRELTIKEIERIYDVYGGILFHIKYYVLSIYCLQ